MKSKTVRLGRAIVLSLLFITTVLSLIGIEDSPVSIWRDIHIWTGTLMLVGSSVHLLTNLDWVRSVFSQPAGNLRKSVKRNRRTDLALFIFGCICTLTGILWLSNPTGLAAMNRPHTVSGMFMILLLGLHLLLHWGWLVNTIRSLRQQGMIERQPTVPGTAD